MMKKLKILEQWQTTSEALDKASEHLLKFGMSMESETVAAVHDAMDEVTKLASVAVGDAFNTLSWYQHGAISRSLPEKIRAFIPATHHPSNGLRVRGRSEGAP